MDEELKDFAVAAPCPTEDIAAAEAVLGVALPEDYKAFLRLHDGACGWIGNTRLVLWRARELAANRRDHRFDELAPGLIAFGGDGQGAALAFDLRSAPCPVVIVPLASPSHAAARPIAKSFAGLFHRMTQPGGSLFGQAPRR